MFKTKRKLYSIVAMLLVIIMTITIVGCAKTQAPEKKYPDKPITVIVAFAAGSATDANARLVLTYVEKYMGQKFVVLNKPGASGQIGWGELAKAKPDGYTIGVLNSPFIQLPIQDPKCEFTIDSFEPIANIVTDPGAIYCPGDKKWNNIADMIAEAKAKPGKIIIGCTGLQTSEARTINNLERKAGVKFKIVPFNGAAELNTAALGGHVDVAVQNVASALSLVNEKKLKFLAVGSAERSPLCPDVPTLKEQGFDVIQFSMRSFAAPKGIDPQIMQVLSTALEKGLKDPEFLSKAKETETPVDFKTGAQLKEMYKQLDKNLRDEWAVAPWVTK